MDPRVGAASILAGILGVSPRTVQRWMSGGVQSCNINAEKLIQASLEHAPEEAKRLLMEDLAQHEREFNQKVRMRGYRVNIVQGSSRR